jgi:hypothetical protein
MYSLIKIINLFNFIVKLYQLKNETNLDSVELENKILSLNDNLLPKDIANTLHSVNGVSKIKIYDQNRKLLIDSLIDIEDNSL